MLPDPLISAPPPTASTGPRARGGGCLFAPPGSVGESSLTPPEGRPRGSAPSPPPRLIGGAPASVHRLETKSHLDAPATRFGGSLHAKHATERLAIVEALETSPCATLRHRARKQWACSSVPWLVVGSDGTPGISAPRCRDRACPRCAALRSRQTAAQAEVAISAMDAPRFVTLTVRSSTAALRDQLKALRAAFSRLRRTRAWKSHVRGGIYTVEITRNGRTGLWHPHLHALVDGVYFPQAELAAAWREATGDSDIVDIRQIHGKKAAARYVAKYATKPSDVASWPSSSICEWAAGIAGSRLIATFGSLHGVTLDARDPNDGPGFGDRLVPLCRIDHALLNGLPGGWNAVGVLGLVVPGIAALYPGPLGPSPGEARPPDPDEVRAALRTLGELLT